METKIFEEDIKHKCNFINVMNHTSVNACAYTSLNTMLLFSKGALCLRKLQGLVSFFLTGHLQKHL